MGQALRAARGARLLAAPLGGILPAADARDDHHGLEAAFAYFGGVPHELLFDQLKAVTVDDARTDGCTVRRER